MTAFKKVTEASYLVAERAWSYRAILRYFYEQHERMREFLYPEDILAYLYTLDEFEDFTEDQLHIDLAQLVKWGNIVARQEMGKVKTVDEFKKKRFRYQTTPYTVEFERMLRELEGLGETFGGSLEKTQFERLYQSLRSVEASLGKGMKEAPEECAQRFDDVMSYFRAITKNTADYLAYLNSEKAEEKMQTEAFLAYKDQFTTYLRDFIVGMQQTSFQIQTLLERLSSDRLHPFFEKVALHQTKTFRFEEENLADTLVEQQEKWQTLQTWFLGDAVHQSEYELLEDRTNESIRRITRVMQRLGERHQQFHSRKKDYLHLAKWFGEMDDLAQAHKLSAVAFGLFHTKHFHSDHVPTDDIYTDVWEEEPMSHETRPRVQGYTEKTRAGAITEHAEEKERVRKQYAEARKRERQLLEQYIESGRIEVSNLPVVEPYVRKVLLSWIGKSMVRKDRTIKSDMGERVKVFIGEGERVVLQSEDGEMKMPDVTFFFLDKTPVSCKGRED